MSNGIAPLSSEERVRDWLTHVVENADRIAEYLDGISLDAFRADFLRSEAVERRLEHSAFRAIYKPVLHDLTPIKR